MAGQLNPVVLMPRFTTLAGRPSSGDVTFATVALDVTPYQSGLINLWRGKLIGTAGNPKFNLWESSDGVNWTRCSGTSADFDPGENNEQQYAPVLKKKWFRMTVELQNADNIVTLWAAGFLEDRES